MSVVLTVDFSHLHRQLAALGAQAPLAVARAMNRTITSVRTAAVREIADDLKIAQKEVREAMTLERASRNTLRATLFVTGRRLALYVFRARQTKPGVTYDLGRGRRLAAGAFIARMRSGHIGAFRRRSARRLPIFELRGPSLPKVFTAERISAAREALAEDLMRKNLAHEAAFLVREISA